jgi:AbiV family abortive infection protein
MMEARSSGPMSVAEAGKVRAACYAHATDLLNAAAKLLDEPSTPNLAYHLALLALEEIGKAGLIGGRAAFGSARDSAWMDKWLSSHSRKLLWALWTPFGKIDPANFTEAKVLAERLHAQRLAGLYVDPSAEGPLPREAVSLDETQSVIELAWSLLRAEPDQPEEAKVDARPTVILEWFLRTLDDPEGMRQLFSPPFLAKYEELGGDAARWADWAKGEFERLAAEADAAMRREFARRPGPESDEQPKWRVRTRVYTISHALRPKVLNYWNDRIDTVKLVSTGKKDEFLLELTLTNAVILSDLYGRALAMTKMMLAFLSIGSIGYFWFEKAAFTRRVFEEIKDLDEPKFKVEIGPQLSFWNSGRAVALTEQHLEHTIECMSTFTPMGDKAAEPIFGPYFQGLALIAKSDVHISTDELARAAFITSLRAALRHYGAWDGEEVSFRDALDRAFQPIIAEAEHRAIVFAALDPIAIGARPISENMVTAKHLADLFLIRSARNRWQQSLLDWQAQHTK